MQFTNKVTGQVSFFLKTLFLVLSTFAFFFSFSNKSGLYILLFLFFVVIVYLKLHLNGKSKNGFILLIDYIYFITFEIGVIAFSINTDWYPTVTNALFLGSESQSEFALTGIILVEIVTFVGCLFLRNCHITKRSLIKYVPRPRSLLIVTLLSFVYTFYIGTTLDGIRSGDIEQIGVASKIIGYLLWDYPIIQLFLVSTSMYIWNNDSVHPSRVLKWQRIIDLLILGFIALSTISGSRGGVLVAISIFIIYPLATSSLLGLQKIYIPVRVILPLFLLSPLVFIIGFFLRLSNIDGGIDEALSILTNSGQIFNILLQRLTSSGFEQFSNLTIASMNELNNFENFVVWFLEGIKNGINIVVPGSLFETKAITQSMSLPDLLSGDYYLQVNREFQDEAISSLNTQPYTFVGILIYGFSYFGYIIYFSLIVSLKYLIKLFSNLSWLQLPIIIGLVYFISTMVACFGIDDSIGNSFHALTSVMIITIPYSTLRNS